MPKKGDDLSGLIADAGMEHLHNYTAIYTPSGFAHPSSKSVDDLKVKFREPYFEENNIIGREPIAICKEADLCGTIVGGKITINNIEYTIVENRPDSKGKTTLFLEKR